MLLQFFSSNIVFPLLALQDSENKSVVVIILWIQRNVVGFQVVSKLLQLVLLLLSQLDSSENHTLILTIFKGQELLVQSGLESLNFFVNVNKGLDFFFCLWDAGLHLIDLVDDIIYY